MPLDVLFGEGFRQGGSARAVGSRSRTPGASVALQIAPSAPRC